MQVGQTVTYTPTTGQQPKPQAAIITDWNADTSKADLIVFPKDAYFGMFQDSVSEGTDPGTFQQLASSAPPAPAHQPAAATTSKK